MVVVPGMARTQLLYGGSDGGFAAVDRVREQAEHGPELRRQVFEVHSRSVQRVAPGSAGEKESQVARGRLNTKLRQSRNKH